MNNAPASRYFHTMVIEDDTATRLLLERVLQSRGHRVTGCADAEEAWLKHERDPHRLMLLDWMLPGMDGLELCRRIRKSPGGDFPVIIMVTQRDAAEALRAAIEAGADDYVAKPFDMELLQVRLTVAEQMLKQREARRAAEEEGRRLEAQVRHAQKMESLGIMAGGIAHEFNNLLMGIQGNAHLADQVAEPDCPARPHLQEIHRATERAAELTTQLLAYSGKGRFIVRTLRLNNEIVDIVPLIEAIVPKKIRVAYAFATESPAVEADASQIRQIVINLVTNSAEAIGNAVGTITISTGVVTADDAYLAEGCFGAALEPGTYAFLDVKDTGSGLSPSEYARAFEPFYTTKFAGRGLGLPAVLGAVRGHNGAVKVISRPGEGAAFRVLLPCATCGAVPAPQPSPAPPSSGGTVLVVDDEDSVRVVLSQALKMLGFQVLTAENGRVALEIVEQNGAEIGAIVLDLTMPEMDGEETFAQLQRIRPGLPVILTSGYAESDATAWAGTPDSPGRNLVGFFQKPFSAIALGKRLRELLGGTSSAKQA